MRSAALAFAAAAGVHAKDPSGGWLSYALYTAPNPTDIITHLSADMVVPERPKQTGGSPAFWFGVQTATGNGALVQPIQSKWEGSNWAMFQEIFDWTDMMDKQSKHVTVQPGDVIRASVTYQEADNSYNMRMTSLKGGEHSNYDYKLHKLQKKTESVAYFVLEHQPRSCDELPPDGACRWTNITVHVNKQVVSDAEWIPKQEKPKCGSKVVVHNSTALDITWAE